MSAALNILNRTKTADSNHHACVWMVCDSFIMGTEPIFWLSKEHLLSKTSVLSVSYLESNAGKVLPSSLRAQYTIKDCNELSDLLLSPRAQQSDGSFMACQTCHRNIAYSKSDKPPLVIDGVLVNYHTILSVGR